MPQNERNSMSDNPDTDDEDSILHVLDEDELLNLHNTHPTQYPISQISQEHDLVEGVVMKLKVKNLRFE